MIKLKNILNEAKPAVVGNMNAFGPSKVLGKGGKVLGFVPDTPNAIATLIQDYPNVQAIEFKSPFILDFKTYKSIKKGDKAWKELMSRGVDNATKAVLKKDFQLKESVNEDISKKHIEKLTSYKDLSKFIKANKSKINSKDFNYIEDEVESLKYLESDYKRGRADRQEVEVAVIDAQDSIKRAMGIKESVNEAKVKAPDYIVTSVPAAAIPPTNSVKAEIMLGLAMGGEFGMHSTLSNRDYKLDYHNGKVALKLTSSGKLGVRVRSEKDPKYVQKIEKFASDYLTKYAKDIKK